MNFTSFVTEGFSTNKPHLYFQKSNHEYKTVLDRINKEVVPALKKEGLGVTIEQNAGHITIKG